MAGSGHDYANRMGGDSSTMSLLKTRDGYIDSQVNQNQPRPQPQRGMGTPIQSSQQMTPEQQMQQQQAFQAGGGNANTILANQQMAQQQKMAQMQRAAAEEQARWDAQQAQRQFPNQPNQIVAKPDAQQPNLLQRMGSYFN